MVSLEFSRQYGTDAGQAISGRNRPLQLIIYRRVKPTRSVLPLKLSSRMTWPV
jgi:hypothetical protein